ncbi:signal peptidase II [Methylomonas sp. MED-D]|uniref:signal peptidase II n=1 Tax=unclassified Methylomonas TaxID=2608980 RepID=UPI0008DAAB97|nr:MULTISPECIES: signal peptidase II [unclassified Methylomonas]MDT4330408.1 signal peptidase II [Methylomonas sp. MV1]NJA05786.1 lipoprotein signal peptidase [Methylococcaceae bacterium WWC4]OHX34942.1 signal peptidase II [Methylomonas sp. LWB]WGS86459.1 signal peptidase II [Methylomonas sp. UP202]
MLKWLWVSVLVLVLDQASKLAIDAHFQLYESIPLLPNFNLTYARNTGAAFSFLAQVGGWQRWLFAGLAVVMSGIIGIWLYRLKRHETMMAWALSLVLGGAIGNLIDRVAYGYVIDFLDVFYRDWHWPVFNIADSAICVGVGLMVLESFGIGRRTAEVLE